MTLLAQIREFSGASLDGGSLVLTRAHAGAETDVMALGGQYSVRADGLTVEIELVEEETRRRAVIYARRDQTVYAFIPKSRYRLYLRFLAPEGVYDAGVRFTRMTARDRLGFLAGKIGQRLLTPRAWPELWRRLRRGQSREIVGATLSSGPSADLPPDPARPYEAPGESTGDGVSIIIPTKKNPSLLSACLRALDMSRATREVVIIDNGATDPDMVALLESLRDAAGVTVIRHDVPFNFAELCNLGARHARYPLLLFLNDDIEALDGDWLAVMTAYAARPDVGVVGARLLYLDRSLQHAGVAVNLVPGPGHPWRGLPEDKWRGRSLIETPGEVDAVTGACLMIRRDLFDAAGGFDEQAFAVTLNDVDLCLKVRARGLKVIYAPQATLLHKESASRRRDDTPEEAERRSAELKAFYERYGAQTRGSVFYPPDLRRDTDQGLPI